MPAFTHKREAMEEAAGYFKVKLGNPEKCYEKGENIHALIPKGLPVVGIRHSIFWEYYNNEKTDFEKILLLGFLGIKSIIGLKTYCRMTNKYWLARMDAQSKSISDNSELSKEIQKYANRWQLTKIKNELILIWGLKHYSRGMKGFYVSFELPLADLICRAEKKRRSFLLKKKKDEEDKAYKEAMERLKNEPP